MKSLFRILLFGLAVWAAPFAIGMAVFAWVPPETALFDTLMSIAMTFAATLFGYLYFKRAEPGLRTGILIGAVWAAFCVALDAPLFLFGMQEMRMSVAEYAADIGLAYLMLPIIAGGLAHAMRRG